MGKIRTKGQQTVVAPQAATVESLERREMFASSYPAPPAPIFTGARVNPALTALTALTVRKAGSTPIDFFLPDGGAEEADLQLRQRRGAAPP